MTEPTVAHPIRFTLDTSCVIHAVSKQESGRDVEELVRLCAEGAGEAWLTTAFDEDQETAGEARRAANRQWITERPIAGWIGQPLRLNFSVLGGRSILIDARTEEACKAMEEVLLPPSIRGARLDAADAPQMDRWRKRVKDVQHLGAHVFYRHDVFVTTDVDDMLKKRDELFTRAGVLVEAPGKAACRARFALGVAEAPATD